MHMIRVWIHDGILASSALGPIDVFATANTLWSRERKPQGSGRELFRWRLESPDGQAVRSASGQSLHVDGPIRAGSPSDAVIVLGPIVGGDPALFLRRWERLRSTLHPLESALQHQHRRGAWIASACSGSFLLAESGLLKGRRATTHWSLGDAFAARFPEVDLRPDDVLTEHERVLCSGAVTSHFSLALRLVEIFGGASLAAATARWLLLDTHRVSQASYRMLTVQYQQPHGDLLVAKAEQWLEGHLRERLELAALARRFAVSERTLLRRFRAALGVSPLSRLQRLRMEEAKRLLETTELSVEAITEQVGYADVSAFRRLFKRATGLTPRGFQQHFSLKGRARST